MSLTNYRPGGLRSFLIAESVATDGTQTTTGLRDYEYLGKETSLQYHDGTAINHTFHETASTSLGPGGDGYTLNGFESFGTSHNSNKTFFSQTKQTTYTKKLVGDYNTTSESSFSSNTIYRTYNKSVTYGSSEFGRTRRTEDEDYAAEGINSNYGRTTVSKKDGSIVTSAIAWGFGSYSSSQAGSKLVRTTVDGETQWTAVPDSTAYDSTSSDDGATYGSYNSLPFVPTVPQRTAFQTTTRLQISRNSETASDSFSFTSSPDSFTTFTDSFSLKTTVFTSTFFTTGTIYTVSAETKTLTNHPLETYKICAALGGGYFGELGTTLTNGLVVGASTATSIRGGVTQPTLEQVFTIEGTSEGYITTFNRDRRKTVYENSTALVTSSTEGTRILPTSTTYDHPVNFGSSVSSGHVFTESTYSITFYASDTTSSYTTTEETTYTVSRGASYTLSDIKYAYVSFLGSYFGSDNLETYTSNGYYQVSTTTSSVIQRVLDTDHTFRATSRFIKNPAQTQTPPSLFIGSFYPLKTIATFDKGLEGAVQYETSSDISGAMRGSRNVTIADERFGTTTTQYRDSSTTYDITVNTGVSGTYESIAPPMVSSFHSLNKYATFLPRDKYGDFRFKVYESDGSSDLGEISFSKLDLGSYLVRYTNTVNYSTSVSDKSNTSTIDTTLNGLFQVGNGQLSGGNFQNIVPVSRRTSDFIAGGFVFTNKKGVLVNKYGAPTTFAAFGSDGSTLISENLSDYPEYAFQIKTFELPSGAVVFQNLTTYPIASSVPFMFHRNA